MTKCAACHRPVSAGKYCLHHDQALKSVDSHYGKWVEAYGGISWQDFLRKLLSMKETGTWVKEVIEVELKK